MADRKKAESSPKQKGFKLGRGAVKGSAGKHPGIFINNLEQAARQIQLVTKSADDMKMGQEMSSVEEREKLQQAIKVMFEWAEIAASNKSDV